MAGWRSKHLPQEKGAVLQPSTSDPTQRRGRTTLVHRLHPPRITDAVLSQGGFQANRVLGKAELIERRRRPFEIRSALSSSGIVRLLMFTCCLRGHRANNLTMMPLFSCTRVCDEGYTCDKQSWTSTNKASAARNMVPKQERKTNCASPALGSGLF
jgi:hypothetical protein